jgi:hypothetical protein
MKIDESTLLVEVGGKGHTLAERHWVAQLTSRQQEESADVFRRRLANCTSKERRRSKTAKRNHTHFFDEQVQVYTLCCKLSFRSFF